MEFWKLVMAIVVALLITDVVRDAIGGIATLTGAAVSAVLRRVWKL